MNEIAERYLIMNGFDGALAILGVVIGSYIAGVSDVKIILSTGFGASLAMGISGALGAFMAEKAQRIRNIKELEQAMFTNLKNSIINRASIVAVIYVALIDAISPIITASIALFPFILSFYGFLSLRNAIIASVILNMSVLFILGIFLGRISKSNMITQGALMVLAGIVTLLLLFTLKLAF